MPAGQLVIGVQQIKMALLRMCIRPGTLRFIDIVGDPDLHRFFQQLRRFTIARIASDQLPDVIFVRMTAFPVGQDLSAGGGNEDRGKEQLLTAASFRDSRSAKYSAISR